MMPSTQKGFILRGKLHGTPSRNSRVSGSSNATSWDNRAVKKILAQGASFVWEKEYTVCVQSELTT